MFLGRNRAMEKQVMEKQHILSTQSTKLDQHMYKKDYLIALLQEIKENRDKFKKCNNPENKHLFLTTFTKHFNLA